MVAVAKGPAVVEWKGRHNVTWDACSKHVGDAERTGWETILVKWKRWPSRGGGQKSKGATTLVVDLATASKEVPLSVVWKWATYFDFWQRVLWMLCGYFARERIENNVPEPMVAITAILSSSKWSVHLCTSKERRSPTMNWSTSPSYSCPPQVKTRKQILLPGVNTKIRYSWNSMNLRTCHTDLSTLITPADIPRKLADESGKHSQGSERDLQCASKRMNKPVFPKVWIQISRGERATAHTGQ